LEVIVENTELPPLEPTEPDTKGAPAPPAPTVTVIAEPSDTEKLDAVL
jgi:hypothetical protein